ncbi:GAF domain-containing protein [Hippea maritima]|uniref:GAF domain protein n=1 Tax=Hippea maritima (strain ATCC 700847 / DSM 10411 / MH2) TaxID=760142 RepID=F2LXF3_HIPMA|nr:GAF domain-containing protein [Hippea maritima]AEA34267.1 GAF domain protein [Hippea maritima DSM 10411]
MITVDITKQKTYETLYKSIAKVNEIVANLNNEDEILSEVCKALNKDVGFDLVCVGEIDKNTKLFKEKFISGKQEYIDIFRSIKISVDESIPEGRGSVGRAYREKRVVAINDIYSDKNMEAWREAQTKFGVYSVCSIPLFKNGEIAYILVLYSKIPNIFKEEFLHLITSISKSTNMAFAKIETEKWSNIL